MVIDAGLWSAMVGWAGALQSVTIVVASSDPPIGAGANCKDMSRLGGVRPSLVAPEPARCAQRRPLSGFVTCSRAVLSSPATPRASPHSTGGVMPCVPSTQRRASASWLPWPSARPSISSCVPQPPASGRPSSSGAFSSSPALAAHACLGKWRLPRVCQPHRRRRRHHQTGWLDDSRSVRGGDRRVPPIGG